MKAVVASFVELSAPAGVGAVGVPVSAGLSSLANVPSPPMGGDVPVDVEIRSEVGVALLEP